MPCLPLYNGQPILHLIKSGFILITFYHRSALLNYSCYSLLPHELFLLVMGVIVCIKQFYYATVQFTRERISPDPDSCDVDTIHFGRNVILYRPTVQTSIIEDMPITECI